MSGALDGIRVVEEIGLGERFADLVTPGVIRKVLWKFIVSCAFEADAR